MGQVNSDTIKRLEEYYELDKPLWQQYFAWISKFVRGDLGYSYYRNEEVSSIIGGFAWETIKLQFMTLAIALPLAIFIGTYTALHQHSTVDTIVTMLAMFSVSNPVFLVGLLLILVFSYYIPLFPSFGAHSTGAPLFGNWLLDSLWHLVLPVIALSTWHFALYVRLVRANMLEVLRQDYILSARCCGLPERRVIYRHALRNALIPIVTYLGLWMGLAIAGAPVVETVFSWPGLGYLFVQSIFKLDYPLIMGITMILTIIVLVVNLVIDLIYCVIDPRIRLE
ncbi:MAG: ABC transporter permease [Candidatus Baldrarchaeia archaeon]